MLAAGLVFALLATANAAGYRFAASDQAFYVPAVARALDPSTFPRDSSLLAAQGGLILVDDALAITQRVTGLSVESVFLGGYLLALAATWVGLVVIGTRLYPSIWITFALGAAFTLRHRIPHTSANSFEPYFHPRMLAFALGMLAIGALMRHRPTWAVILVAVASVIHTTTALWFAVLLGVALAVLEPAWRRLALVGGVGAAAVLAWAATLGPLRGMWTTMDPVWLQAVASKDSLFADQWPLWAWFANLGMLALLWAAHAWRCRLGTSTPVDAALAWGATALVGLFLATLPLVIARLPLAVEFQISRVFWPIDLLATAYLLAALTEGRPAPSRLGPALAGVLIALSLTRGIYVMFLEHPERPLFAVTTPDTAWEDAMRWLARQPLDTHVLADPGHSWKFGTSVRVTAGRDVYLEEVKDSALAIYSRAVAGRVVERTRALGDFASLTPERARTLAAQYDLDVLVSDAEMALPVLYRNVQFRIYDIRPSSPPLGP